MAEVRPMTAADAQALQVMMHGEEKDYLRHFVAFTLEGELQRQRAAAKRDGFFSLLEGNKLVGFFCLRGLDEGYVRPSFGVYVASSFKGRGLGRFALGYALDWCQDQGISKVMLKVAEDNVPARRMYEAAGFTFLGICPDTGHLIMERGLT